MDEIKKIDEKKAAEAPAAAPKAQEAKKEADPKAAQQADQKDEAKGQEPVDQYRAAGVKGDAAGGGSPGSEIIIDKNGTKMNAQEVNAIAQIYMQEGTTRMKPEELAEQLKAQGMDVYTTEVNGKKGIKFANGDTFIDTSGNGVLDNDDAEWREAVKTLGEKYGIDVSKLKAGGGGNKDNNAVQGIQGLNNANLLNNQLMNPAFDGVGGAGEDGQGARQLQKIFEELDGELADKGYQGPMSEELHTKGELDPVLEQYGIQKPQMPGQNQQTDDMVNAIFQSAYQIALQKQ